MTDSASPSGGKVSPDPAAISPARAVVEAIQQAFQAADYERMAALYHDDIDWLLHGPVSIFPEAGHRRGKADVFRSFEILNTQYHFESYAVDFLIAEGDRAATVADVQMIQRSSGRTIWTRTASFHRVQDGRLISYRGFVDSFDAVEQVLGKLITP